MIDKEKKDKSIVESVIIQEKVPVVVVFALHPVI